MTWSERARRARALAALLLGPLLATLLIGASGCGRAAEDGFLLAPLVVAGRYAVGRAGEDGLAFPSRPQVATVEIDHERRRAVVTGEGTWRWRGRVPEGARLVAGVQALPGAGAVGLEARVTLRDGREREVLDVVRAASPPADSTEAAAGPRWLTLRADLSRYAGREVSLEFSAVLAGAANGNERQAQIPAGSGIAGPAGGTTERQTADSISRQDQAGSETEVPAAGATGGQTADSIDEQDQAGSGTAVPSAGATGGGIGGPSSGARDPAVGPIARQTRRHSEAAIAWAPVALGSPSRAASRGEEQPPNILFILVDTLRRDRLTPYGYRRDTSPEIAARLAARGAVVESAYSQAPWTLPSVVSFLTGRYPGEMLGDDLASYGVPPGVATLAERLAALGYQTGAFMANPSLHAGAGFERGFGTFFAPPADVEWIRKHADLVNARALPWLAAHEGGARPFFAYVHYIDPHDPYENPETAGNRSAFLPGYTGPVTGEWVHGVYTGRLTLPDPPRDLAHLNALYDSEVHYVDRHVGELIGSLAPEALANTLVVLTSDHGEELFDHGGWKHGQTLYDEQIRVPLLVRWDGRIPPGRRLDGTVRLLDLMPTLVGAAGGEPDPDWHGIDLLPALSGTGPLPERPAFSQHLASGPLRAAVIEGGRKLILFNRETPFAPADNLQAHLWRLDLGRMAREELYDLGRDPGERRSLLASRPPLPPRLAGALHRQLDRQLPGLRVLARAAAAGSRLGGSIRFERPPAGWTPYFLAAGDRVALAGDRLDFDLGSEPLDKGFLVDGDVGAVLSIEARRDGVPLGPGGVRLGDGAPYAGSGGAPGPGGPVAPRLLAASAWPLGPGARQAEAGALHIWLHPPRRGGERRLEHDPETERRLRNLGYIQ